MKNKRKIPALKRWCFITLLVIILVSVIGCGVENNQKEVAGGVPIEQVKKTDISDGAKQVEKSKENIPKEYQSALKKADIYVNSMYMSKASLYNQLVSEFGEGFSEEAAQYAVDNVEANWKENALQKAIIYQDDMAMSPNSIYDQLISEHGEQFTEEEAKHAIDNLPK